MKRVEVHWLDAFSDAVDNWRQRADLDADERVIVTTGWLLPNVIAGYVSVAQSVDSATDTVCHVLHIPSASVLSTRKLEVQS